MWSAAFGARSFDGRGPKLAAPLAGKDGKSHIKSQQTPERDTKTEWLRGRDLPVCWIRSDPTPCAARKLIGVNDGVICTIASALELALAVSGPGPGLWAICCRCCWPGWLCGANNNNKLYALRIIEKYWDIMVERKADRWVNERVGGKRCGRNYRQIWALILGAIRAKN